LLKWIGRVSAEVFWMAVDPTVHRSGIGRALLEAAIATAHERGTKYFL
jgi:GNAT superfamily N-acetyltransferase